MTDRMKPDELDRLLSSHHGREPGNRPGAGLGIALIVAALFYLSLFAALIWGVI